MHTILGLMSMSHICLQPLFHLILHTNARGHTFHSARNQNDDGGLLKILFGCAHRRHQKVLTQSGLGCRGVLAMGLADSTHQSHGDGGEYETGGTTTAFWAGKWKYAGPILLMHWHWNTSYLPWKRHSRLWDLLNQAHAMDAVWEIINDSWTEWKNMQKQK